MNYNEICQLAELTRRNLRYRNRQLGNHVADLVDTQEQEKQESEYRKLKRIKAENTVNYRKQLKPLRVSSITDMTKSHYTAPTNFCWCYGQRRTN